MHAFPRLALITVATWSLLPSCIAGKQGTESEVREGLYHKDDGEPEASKAHALDVARLELTAAQLDANAKDRAAAKAADFAESEVEQARKELEHADKQAAIRTRDGENNLKRAAVRLDETKAELIELESMYKDEEFAEKTKELVLTRGKSQVEMATAALEVETLRQDLLVKEELPAERGKAELTLRKAEAALEAAQLEREACALRGKIAVMKAEEAVRAAEAEAAKEG
jgi:hypothetical protein